MAIDTSKEKTITLAEAANDFCGRQVNVATVARWCFKGCRRTVSGKTVVLDSLLIGGVRVTSKEAVQRFIAAQNAVEDQQPEASNSQLERQGKAARKALAKMGV